MLMSLITFYKKLASSLYTLSLHDALPIWLQVLRRKVEPGSHRGIRVEPIDQRHAGDLSAQRRSEEHTSELQSRPQLVCRLLLEKKKYVTKLLSSLATI